MTKKELIKWLEERISYYKSVFVEGNEQFNDFTMGLMTAYGNALYELKNMEENNDDDRNTKQI